MIINVNAKYKIRYKQQEISTDLNHHGIGIQDMKSKLLSIIKRRHTLLEYSLVTKEKLKQSKP